MPFRFMTSLTDAALDLNRAADDSTRTVCARLPIFAQHVLAPSAAGLAEWQLAVSEKMMAAWEGQIAACSAWQAAAFRSAVSPATPLGLAQDALAVMQALSRPAHRMARDNARRLHGSS